MRVGVGVEDPRFCGHPGRGRMDGWMAGWTDRWARDQQISPLAQQPLLQLPPPAAFIFPFLHDLCSPFLFFFFFSVLCHFQYFFFKFYFRSVVVCRLYT